MKTTITTSAITVASNEVAKSIRFSENDHLVELLLYNDKIVIKEVRALVTKLAGSPAVLAGPALCGIIPSGYHDKKKGGAAVAWTRTTGASVNGLTAVPDPGSAESQTVVMKFEPRNGDIFGVNPKIEPVFLFAAPHFSVPTGTTAHLGVYSVICQVDIEIS